LKLLNFLLLFYEIPDFEDESVVSDGKLFPPSGYHVVNSEDGKVTLTEAHFRELQNNLESLHISLAQKNDEIQILQGDVARMRSLSRALLEAGISDKTSSKTQLTASIL